MLLAASWATFGFLVKKHHHQPVSVNCTTWINAVNRAQAKACFFGGWAHQFVSLMNNHESLKLTRGVITEGLLGPAIYFWETCKHRLVCSQGKETTLCSTHYRIMVHFHHWSLISKVGLLFLFFSLSLSLSHWTNQLLNHPCSSSAFPQVLCCLFIRVSLLFIGSAIQWPSLSPGEIWSRTG